MNKVSRGTGGCCVISRARNRGQRSVTRQHARDRRARFGECDRRGRHDLIGVAELLFCAQPIESRAFAFSLTGAKDLDEPFHLAHVGSKGLEPFLLGDDASDRRGGIGAEQPEPQVALGLCGGGRRNAGSRQRVTRSEQRQRLLRLEEFGEARPFPAVRDGRIRIREPRELARGA